MIERKTPPPLSVRVYYEDTDFSGVVYYANYLRFLERGRTETLRFLGVNQSELHTAQNLMFAVRRLEVDYIKPARMDDMLLIYTQITDVRGASLRMEQHIMCHDILILTAKIQIALINANGKPAKIPTALRGLF
jgi:acyl-CoA thioester hydrolase